MGGLLGAKPKAPAIVAPKEIPDATNQIDVQRKRQAAAAAIMKSGVPATQLTNQQKSTTFGA